MNYLAIDTSGDLIVLLKANGKRELRYLKGCNTKHSLTLMPYVEEVLNATETTLNDLDFIAVVTGPGSFTGIRIGIATVKALCFAANKPALALTSFDLLAYTDNAPSQCFCIVDANHGNYYCASFNNNQPDILPCFLTTEQIKQAIGNAEIVVNGAIDWFKYHSADLAVGLERAVEQNLSTRVSDASDIQPLYVKRSQAEEELC